MEVRWGERRKKLSLRWPYEKSAELVRDKALSRPEFDPAVLAVWGQVQANMLLELTKAIEGRFGAAGQEMYRQAFSKVGRDVATQMLDGVELPQDLSAIELVSLFFTWMNEVPRASIEESSIDSPDECSFHIHYCPYEAYFGKFDCRINRYLFEGMLEVAHERLGLDGCRYDMLFDYSVQQGRASCHFRISRQLPGAPDSWREYSDLLQRNALERARAEPLAREGDAASGG